MSRTRVIFALCSVLVACGGSRGAIEIPPDLPRTSETPLPMPHDYDVRHYEIELAFDHESVRFTGEITMYATPLIRRLRCVEVHAAPELTVSRVVLDEVELEATREGDVLRVCPEAGISADEEFVITYAFAGEPSARDHYGAFVVTPDDGRLPMLYTQFESQGARRMLPLYDEPFDKATTRVTLHGDERYALLANGLLEDETVEGGVRTAVWDNADPISPYLITVVVAELDRLDDTYRRPDGTEVPLTVWTEPGRAEEGRYTMDAILSTMAFFEDAYGMLYPWETYAVVAVPGFRYGGMENKGLANLIAERVHFTEDDPITNQYGIYGLVAHELAHEWFGNLVTMQWWSDLWLNEGFASYMDSEAFRAQFGTLGSRIWQFYGLQRWYMPLERSPFAHPIVHSEYTDTEELFDAISYTKGEKVIEMLRALMGDESFDAGLSAHLAQNAVDNADTTAFFDTMQAHTDVDLTAFVESWLLQAGFPTLNVSWTEQGEETLVRIEQVTPMGEPGDWVIPIDLRLGDATGGQSEDVRLVITDHITEVSLPFTGSAYATLNRDGVALVDVEMPQMTTADWQARITYDPDPLVRAIGLFRLWELASVRFESGEDLSPAIIEMTQLLLRDQEWRVTAFALGALTDSEWPLEVREAAAQALAPALRERLAEWRAAERSFETADCLGSAVSVMGLAGGEANWTVLREIVDEAHPDVVTDALAAYLRTEAPGRRDAIDQLRSGAADDATRRRQYLSAWSSHARDAADLEALASWMDDPTIVPEHDNRMMPSLLAPLVEGNEELEGSQLALDFVFERLRQELDRPGIVSGVVRRMDRIDREEPAVASRIRNHLVAFRGFVEEETADEGILATIDALLDAIDSDPDFE